MWRNILYFKSSVGCKLKTKINEKYFECYLHIHNFKFVINNLSIFLTCFQDIFIEMMQQGKLPNCPNSSLRLWYSRPVLSSWCPGPPISRRKSRKCACLQVFKIVAPAKSIISKNKESIFRVILSCPNFYGSSIHQMVQL